MTNTALLDRRLQIPVTAEMDETVDCLAHANRMNKAEWIRHLITKAIGAAGLAD
jgi:hypothetical protein